MDAIIGRQAMSATPGLNMIIVAQAPPAATTLKAKAERIAKNALVPAPVVPVLLLTEPGLLGPLPRIARQPINALLIIPLTLIVIMLQSAILPPPTPLASILQELQEFLSLVIPLLTAEQPIIQSIVLILELL